MAVKYSGSFPKLSVSNSFTIEDKIVYHKKEGKCRCYYSYESKYLLGFSFEYDESSKIKVGLTHEEFIEYLKENFDRW